jgi:hypothetical protein
MQVMSGHLGRDVHFEAPAAARLDDEMARFLDWFNGETTTDFVLKAAQSHLRRAPRHRLTLKGPDKHPRPAAPRLRRT